MNKQAITRKRKAGNVHKARSNGHGVSIDSLMHIDSLMTAGSWQRVAVGVAAAVGGGLLAVAVVGVGPAAVAGTAGYLAYRKLSREGGTRA